MANHSRLMEELHACAKQQKINIGQQLLNLIFRQNLDMIKFKLKRLARGFRKPKTNKLNKCISVYNPDYFSDHKIAIYTSIFGNYDQLKEPVTIPDNCDFFVFTDQEVSENSNWQKLEIEYSEFGLPADNILKNRFVKIFPERFFPNYAYSIYVDGSVQIRTDLTPLIQSMNQYGLRMHHHAFRDCAYEEIKACIHKHKDVIEKLQEHRAHLEKNGMPHHSGLLEATIIVRDHRNPILNTLMEAWWAEFTIHSHRDQVSLAYVLWKNHIDFNIVGDLGSNLRYNTSFRKFGHN